MSPSSSKKRQVHFTQNGSQSDKEEEHVTNLNANQLRPSDNDMESSNEVWFPQEERWDVTWPIWHMLSRQDRRLLALKHGYKTIGEYEEYMIMQQAVGDSKQQQSTHPYENHLVYDVRKETMETSHLTHDAPTSFQDRSFADCRANSDQMTKPPPSCNTTIADGEVGFARNQNQLLEEAIEAEQLQMASDNVPSQELIQMGGLILMLPEELIHRVFDYLPVDAYATLALVSPHWRPFTRTEAVYRRLCERLYLNQSKRRALHVSRFGSSYRTMLERRPRVRAGGGVYVLRYCKVKPIQRDMWTEIPLGTILETVYYRYLYFHESGKVTYALTPTPPQDMFSRIRKMCVNNEDDPAAVSGTYTVQKNKVFITVRQSWQYVLFELSIEPVSIHGKFGVLSVDRHVTSTRPEFDSWCPSTTVFEVPDQPFRFVHSHRL